MSYMITSSGRKFTVGNLLPEDVSIVDVANALSKICRFGGHTKEFYSVAQHSVHVFRLVFDTDPDEGLQALLHDSGEAYVGDITTPFKELVPIMREHDKQAREAVFCSLGIRPHLSDLIKQADAAVLALERFHQMDRSGGLDRIAEIAPLVSASAISRWGSMPAVGWKPQVAKDAFLSIFDDLYGEVPRLKYLKTTSIDKCRHGMLAASCYDQYRDPIQLPTADDLVREALEHNEN